MFICLVKRRHNFKWFDRVLVLFLLGLNVLLALFHFRLENWYFYFCRHLLVVAVIVLLIPHLDGSKHPLLRFLRNWYPVIGYPFLYQDVGHFLQLMHSGEFDAHIISFEKALLGTISSVWVQQFVRPAVTEIMQIFYAIYWITIPLSAGILYIKKRQEAFDQLLFYITITFIISYLFFIFIPVAGPRFALADEIAVSYRGLWVSDTLRSFVADNGYRGGAFPSSHVAVAVVILMLMFRFELRIAVRFFLPAVMGLSLATVYGQYHYFTDMIAGLLLGLFIGTIGLIRVSLPRKKNFRRESIVICSVNLISNREDGSYEIYNNLQSRCNRGPGNRFDGNL